MDDLANTEVTRGRRVSKRKLLIGFGIFLVLLVVVATTTLIYKRSQGNTLPKDVKSQVSGFQPYYFSKNEQLPSGLKIDRSSIRYELGTLFFKLSTPDGKSVTVSQQSVPKEFSAEGGSFIGKESVDTKNGKATISYVEGRTSAFMITNDRKTMVILNSNQAIETDTIRSILSSLNSI